MSADLLPLPSRQRNAKPWAALAAVGPMADASTGRSTGAKMAEPVGQRLSSSIVELASTLTRYNQEIAERTAEKERMGKILAEFRKHIAWQGQRKQLMRRNQERLFNESSWLEGKTAEVLVARPSPPRHRLGTAGPSPCLVLPAVHRSGRIWYSCPTSSGRSRPSWARCATATPGCPAQGTLS